MWMRLIKRLLLVGALLFVSLGATAWWAHQQTQKVPEFYEQAIALPPAEDLAKSSEQLEANVQQLQDDAIQLGVWEAEFAVEQINAWLIDQLPKRFPGLQARGLQDPRVMIRDGAITAAARFKDHRLDAVLSCELSVRLTDHPNRLAVSLHSLRAGALPLPLSQFKERIQKIAAKTNLNLQWDTRDGETVGLIDVPSEYPGHVDQSVIIESIQLLGQRLVVAGKTGDLQMTEYSPEGPVYRLALLDEDGDSDLQTPVRNVHAEAIELSPEGE